MSPSTSTNERGPLPAMTVPAPLKAGAFWSAVLLPFLTLGLLASGLDSNLHYVALAVLLGANVLALVIGHDYGQ